MQPASEISQRKMEAPTNEEWVEFEGSHHFTVEKNQSPEEPDTQEEPQKEAANVEVVESPQEPEGEPASEDPVEEKPAPEEPVGESIAVEPTVETPLEEESVGESTSEDETGEASSSEGEESDKQDASIRRMSHIVTPPRQRRDLEEKLSSSLKKRGNSIILDITSPPDLMQPRPLEGQENPELVGVSPMSSTTNRRPQGFGTPPRRDGSKPGKTPRLFRSAPAKKNSIDWFKNSRDRGVAHSLTLTDKSRRNLAVPIEQVPEDEEQDREKVAVFNANTPEGSLTVKALSKRGCNVIAVVRVFTSRNTKELLRLPRVTVKIADSHDRKALASAIEGADRAILVTKYWERFENRLEETQADIIIDACHDVGVPHIVFSTFEDIKLLSTSGKKSQIVPKADGSVEPKFHGMQDAKQKAESYNILLTHMMTSYLDQEKSKKSLCLLSSANGKVIVRPYFKDV